VPHANDPDIERLRRELAQRIARYMVSPETRETPVPRLRLARRDAPTEPFFCTYGPALAFVAQGAKQVILAGEPYVYDQANYLVTSVDLPVSSRVIQASREKPYLSLSLQIDLRQVSELMAEMGRLPTAPAPSGRCLSVSQVSQALMEAVLRLVRLLEVPMDIPVLAPLMEREILYRLLAGPQGPRLCHLATRGTQSRQIGKVIGWMKKNLDRPVKIEALAQQANMSVSSLHHQFKAIAGMSPLQYQKQLRLQEARRLMLTGTDAASAGYRVGYESPSHFSRDYRRIFGEPPQRDVARVLDAGQKPVWD
jgi:AraC-like DNA-binding protein